MSWTMQGRFGAETWLPGAAGFASVVVAGETIALPADAATQERLGMRASGCSHPGPFPGAFRHCPHCGAALGAAPEIDRSLPWSPPFGATDGLPDRNQPGHPDPDSHSEIILPVSAALGLAVAGTPARLLACDRISGWVSAWSEPRRVWDRLIQTGACPVLPGWSAAATERGLALPTERGPVWIDLTRPRTVSALLPDIRCTPAGGVARIGPLMLAPVRSDGRIMVAVLDQAGSEWGMVAVQGAPLGGDLPFDCPVTASEGAFWCNAAGQLAVQSTADGLQARWVVWTDGIVPIPGVRPVVARDGTLHRLCRLDPATLVHESLAFAGQTRERRVARFYAPGTGRAVFRENTRLRVPWDDRIACDYPLEDDGFLLPLFAFDADRFLLGLCGPRARLGRMLGDPAAAAPEPDEQPVACRLFYSPGPRRLDSLECVLRARHAADVSVVIHDRMLLVHDAVENRCHRWELRDGS